MSGLTKIWKDKDVTIQTKRRLMIALIFLVVMNRCESWTLKNKERKKIDSFEMWCWRRRRKFHCHLLIGNLEAGSLK